MTIREEIKKERKKFLATATPKEKWNYFCDYYGLLTISLIVIAFFVTYIIVDTVSKPEVVLNGAFINLTSDRAHNADELGTSFIENQELDAKEYGVSFGTGLTIIASDRTTSYESSQALMTQAAGGALDFITGQNKVLLDYAYGGLFVDLSTILSEEDLKLYQPYLHYIDEAVVELRQEREDALESYEDITLPDSRKPEEMERPIPVFIDLGGNEKMSSVYGNTSDLILGLSVNAPNPGMTRNFIKYLLD